VPVKVARLGDADMSLDFSNPTYDGSGFASLEARLHGTRFDVGLGFYAHDPTELVEYFRQLDEDWRGWSGERQYASVESDLVLSARHVRRIELSVSLTAGASRDVSALTGWSCCAVVAVEAGEELSRFVGDLDDLLQRPSREDGDVVEFRFNN
jgi:hypothetical protein